MYEFLLLIHLLLFVYWLGGDLGVFYSSQFVANGSLSNEARTTAANIMLGCDLVPKICMSLMLTVGGLLSSSIGIEHPTWQIAGIVLIGPFWLCMVLILHYKHHASFIPALTKFDFYFRWLLVFGLLASCAYSYSTGRLEDQPWLILKLIGFAALVFCGLMIRLNLGGFNTTYIKLIQGETPSQQDNDAMQSSLKVVRRWVVSIWVLLLIEAWLGITHLGA